MKLTIEKNGEIVKAIKAEYSPVEALILNDALHRYAEDREVNVTDRLIAQHMLAIGRIEEGED